MTLTKVSQPASPAGEDEAAIPAAKLNYLVNGTLMKVDLPRPLPPGGRQAIEIGVVISVRAQQQPDGHGAHRRQQCL